MPRRLPHERHWNTNDTREELVSRATTASLTAGNVTARLVDVPLFRNGKSGLDQAIRVRLDGNRTAPTTVRLRIGDEFVSEIVMTPVETTGHLFLPEVLTPTQVTIELAADGTRATTEFTVSPQRKFTVHLIHHSHFDYGYTDPQAMVLEHQLRYIDAALDLLTATDDWDPQDQFRWNIEVTYPLRHWLDNHPKSLHEELFRRVREGRVEINGLAFSMHTEVYSIDELAWALNETDRMRNEHGIDIVSAIQSDVPGATIGLLNLLTSAEIRYLSVAHNYAGRSIPFLLDGQELTKPFWWQGADGKKLLVWMSDTPHGVAYMDGVIVGTSESTEVTRNLLPDYLSVMASRPYPYGKKAFGWHDIPAGVEVTKQPYPHDIIALRVQNGFADNAPPTMVLAETVREWNATYAFPTLRISTNRDFFADAEARVGDKLDTFTGDWTDWWVDGVGSAALPLGLNRQTQATIRTAQTLHTLSGNTTSEIAARVDAIYEDAALFDEHTWGSANPWLDKLETFDSGQLQWGKKSAFAYTAFDNANELLVGGLNHLAGDLRAALDALASLIVFNPSARVRSDLVRVFVPLERFAADAPARLLNAASGATVPYTIELQPNWGFRAKGQWITFVAKDLVPLGYTRFDLVAGSTKTATSTGAQLTLESPFYRVEIDPAGFISSITDLESGRELVDTDAPFGFNEYIYDSYTSAAGFNHLSGRIQDVDLTLMGDRFTGKNAVVLSRTTDTVADSITVSIQTEGAKSLETTISLPRDLKRINISNRLFKTATPEKESVYFAFPFAVADQDPLYEITGGATTQSAPHVPGSAQHMFAIRHWLGLQDEKGSAAWATMEAPLIELGTIALPYAPFPSTIPVDRISKSTIYSWALNNMWDTNFPPKQGGEILFRYAISSSATTDRRTLGIETGATFSAPLVGFTLRPGSTGQVAEPCRSWISVANPEIELIAVRPGRDGGVAVLLHSSADGAVTTTVDFTGFAPKSAEIGNHLQRNNRPLAMNGSTAEVTIASGALVAITLRN